MVEALVIAVLTDAELIVVGVIVIALKLAVSVSYSVDVPAEVAVDLFEDKVAGVALGVLTEIGIEVLTDVNGNAVAVVITAFMFPVSTPLER